MSAAVRKSSESSATRCACADDVVAKGFLDNIAVSPSPEQEHMFRLRQRAFDAFPPPSPDVRGGVLHRIVLSRAARAHAYASIIAGAAAAAAGMTPSAGVTPSGGVSLRVQRRGYVRMLMSNKELRAAVDEAFSLARLALR